MKRNWIIIFIVILSLSIGACSSNEWSKNEKSLRSKVKKESVEKVIILTEYTDFEWDTLYVFMPYITKESIYYVIGYEFADIKETVNDDMNQVIFMKDGKVVCYVYGYPYDNGYGFLYKWESTYKKFLSKDNPKFNLKFYEKYVLFEHVS